MNQPQYARLSERYFRNAETLLSGGNASEAGELLWGTTATLVKAIAERQGWRHTSHRDLGAAIRRIVEESGDTDLIPLFANAEKLHSNFYENRYSVEEVQALADYIKVLIEKLKSLAS